MKLVLKFALFVLFGGLVFIPSHSMAQVNTDTVLPDSKDRSEITFPTIEGWEKGDIVTYPNAELGYSLPYKSREGGSVTIYVYNGGNRQISGDLSDNVITAELTRAKNEIKKYGELGYYDKVKEVKSGTVQLGGTSGKVNSLHSLFNFAIRGTDVTSEIYLFSYNNNFIKIRATRPLEEVGAKNEAFSKLMAEMDTLFAK